MNGNLHGVARCRICHLVILLFFFRMTSGLSMVLAGVVTDGGTTSGNESMSLATEGPVAIASEWPPINPSWVRLGIARDVWFLIDPCTNIICCFWSITWVKKIMVYSRKTCLEPYQRFDVVKIETDQWIHVQLWNFYFLLPCLYVSNRLLQ